MIDLVWEDIEGHKLRTFLTTIAIVISLTTIIALGSISSGMNVLVEEQLKLVSGKISVSEGSVHVASGPPAGKVNYSDIEEIKKISGVESVAGMRIYRTGRLIAIGGEIEKRDEIGLGAVKLEEGDWPDVGSYSIVMGYNIRDDHDLNVGDTINLEGEDLKVIGHIEEVGGFVDDAVMMSWKTMDEVYGKEEYFTIIFVKPQDMAMLKDIADRIREDFPHLYVATTESEAENSRKTIATIRMITLSIGIVATIVAMFGIVNTMMMAVSEKKRQIGIMKAIGASKWQIMWEFFEESLSIGFIGCVIGVIAGYVCIKMLNFYLGMHVARLTMGLVGISCIIILASTVAATIYPAYRAAKIDPITSIRSR